MNKFILSISFAALIALNAYLNLGIGAGKRSKQLYFNVINIEEELGHRQLATLSVYNTSEAPIPVSYSDAANVWEPLSLTDQPVFWYIAKTGGATFSSIVAKCLGLVQCSPKGDSTGTNIPAAPPVQTVIHVDDHGKYLNINPIDFVGMHHLATLDVIPQRFADIIITPRVVDAADLMSSSNQGRFMVMLRHPVKREIDMFYYRQAATWDPNFDANLALMSIHDYVDSDKMLDNFIIRSLLSLDQSADITGDDLKTAKSLLRQKFIVGIFEWYEASISRFEKYLGWWEQFLVGSDPVVNQCHFDEVNQGNHDAGWNPDVPAGSPTYNKFVIRNWADIELYAYAKLLYSEQSLLFEPDPSQF